MLDVEGPGLGWAEGLLDMSSTLFSHRWPRTCLCQHLAQTDKNEARKPCKDSIPIRQRLACPLMADDTLAAGARRRAVWGRGRKVMLDTGKAAPMTHPKCHYEAAQDNVLCWKDTCPKLGWCSDIAQVIAVRKRSQNHPIALLAH